MDAREITALGRSAGSQPLIVGNRVFDILPTTEQLIDFPSRKKYLLLQLLWRGMSIEEAAEKSNLTLDDARSYRDSEKAKNYLQKKELASILAEEARDPDRWWVTGHEVMEGHRTLNKGQMVVFQAQGDRVAPKRADSEERGKTVINFNFSPESVKEAFRRQEIIETQIAEEQRGD